MHQQWYIAQQLCQVLVHLHSLNPPILYLNLTSTHVLLSEKDQIKLCDFSRAIREGSSSTGVDYYDMSTVPWMAPEVLEIAAQELASQQKAIVSQQEGHLPQQPSHQIPPQQMLISESDTEDDEDAEGRVKTKKLKNESSRTNNSAHRITTKADIWSLGCVLLEIFTNTLPWRGLHNQPTLIIEHLCRAEPRRLPPQLECVVEPHIRTIIEHCLQINPDDRPTALQVLSDLKDSHSAYHQTSTDNALPITETPALSAAASPLLSGQPNTLYLTPQLLTVSQTPMTSIPRQVLSGQDNTITSDRNSNISRNTTNHRSLVNLNISAHMPDNLAISRLILEQKLNKNPDYQYLEFKAPPHEFEFLIRYNSPDSTTLSPYCVCRSSANTRAQLIQDIANLTKWPITNPDHYVIRYFDNEWHEWILLSDISQINHSHKIKLTIEPQPLQNRSHIPEIMALSLIGAAATVGIINWLKKSS